MMKERGELIKDDERCGRTRECGSEENTCDSIN